MATKNAKAYPETMYVYICDYEDDEPIYAATTDIRDIEDGEFVCTYRLDNIKLLKMTTELV